MNSLAPAGGAYGRAQTAARTPRGIEYEVIARVTRRLKAAADHRQEDFPAFVAAVMDNLTLWTTLGLDVAEPTNALPAQLRAQLFYLFEFTNQHSRKLLNGDDASPDILIEINTSVMRGLRGEGGVQ
ncbi:flagellar biosynthesis regulator FlaF [Rhodobaculum claviforme]|uniref:Flagellar biosynthesis regulator FlhF n=1 Tax=Rhodobaculum claviforme TaxID=1549854 RepID=A0A934WJ45_9RHOB|nr:flagellar biosynthesis regulator FlaF [Rhodobaculum claviforme]MBK5927646.1 flagellar biosynthesis regulator FlhF [Rhodobaculum claviforme]